MSGHVVPEVGHLLVWAALALTTWPTLIVLARRLRMPLPAVVAALLSWLVGRGLLSLVTHLALRLAPR